MSASDVAWVLIKFPAAAPITLAFHDSMNIAPAPYIKLNNKQNISTFMLFRNILLSRVVCAIFPVTCWFRFDIVCDCTLKTLLVVSFGSTKYHIVNARLMPMNSVK